jgi:hypothetical protein
MSVPVQTEGAFQPIGQPSVLFQTTLRPDAKPFGHFYTVSDDGKRFLIISPPNAVSTNGISVPITVVVNWTAALRK